jgi:AraC-like DNA-binding protein
VASLDPLYRQCLLRSRQRVESHRLIAEELSDYRLGWHGRADVDTAVYRLRSPQLALYSMAYGDEVDILPQCYRGFALVHYARSGPIEVVTDGHRIGVAPGEVVVSAPRRSIALRWSAGCEQVILRVPLALLGGVLRTPGTDPDSAGAGTAVALPPAMLLAGPAAEVWRAQLDAYAQYVAFADSQDDPARAARWLEHTERAIAGYVVQQAALGAPRTGRAPGSQTGGASASDRRRARAERWMNVVDARLKEPAGLAELADAMALSPRQLSDWTRRQWGVSPMAWLRQRRLEAVRAALLDHPAQDVTRVALEHGFGHLGRFARQYRERFGEYPNETRRR